MSPSNGSNVGLGGPGTSVATDFVNDFLNATTAAWQDQLARWAGILQQMRQGRYTASSFQNDLVGMWDSWISLAAFPVLRSTQYARQFPSLLMLVDGVAETVGPDEVAANISLPPDLTPEVTDLHQLGGQAVLGKEHVQIRFIRDGSRVEVTLVNLGSGKAAREANGIAPGFYVGPVFVRELAVRRPLALVYVYIEEPAGP